MGVLVASLLSWPSTVGDRQSVMQGRTVRAITFIHSAEVEYFSVYGRWGQLQDLGRFGAEPNELAIGRSGPYDITLDVSKDGYKIYAVPRYSQCRGCRAFYSDQSMTVRMSR